MNYPWSSNSKILNEIKSYVSKITICYDRTKHPNDWKITTIHGLKDTKTVVVGECFTHVINNICDELEKHDDLIRKEK